MVADRSRLSARRGQVTGRTVWLASYPKSGNTWIRAVFTALVTPARQFGLDRLEGSDQPSNVALGLPMFGLDSRWFDNDENDRVRYALSVYANGWPAKDFRKPPPPLLRKTHEVFRPGQPGCEPFPLAVSRAAILVVRDPRDVVCSFAPFFGVSLDKAVEVIGREGHLDKGSPARCRTTEPWGSWSSHARSWLPPDLPFPVYVIRYEDLIVDAVAALAPAFTAIGVAYDRARLEDAVELCRFEKLQRAEISRGFWESNPQLGPFFRRGKSAGWHDQLNERQVAAIEADHAAVMLELGYALTTDEGSRTALAEARASQRLARRVT